MTIDRRTLAGALATLLLVAACGGSASPAPTSEPGAPTAPAATVTPEATEAPQDTQEPEVTEGPDISLAPGAAGDLEAMLPSEVNGVAFTKTSFDGASVPGGIPLGEDDDAFTTFLQDNGKSLSDVKVAIASPTDTASGGTLVMAIQVEGVPSDEMLAWVGSEMQGTEKTTVGGKEVYGAATGGFGAYFYVKGDTVFYVLSMGGENLADAIISKLP